MPKRVLQGQVVSTKGDKTAVIKVQRTFKHPLYGKTVRSNKKYHAHDENNSAVEGTMVQIRESKPFSKMKRWELISDTAAKATASSATTTATGK